MFRCFKYTSSSCTLFTSVGTTILEQLGILFAIGVAIGMAKKNDGAVALAAALGFYSYSSTISRKISNFVTN